MFEDRLMRSKPTVLFSLIVTILCAPARAQAPEAAPSPKVPAGTIIVVRTAENLDSRKVDPGHDFSVTLENDLAANGKIVAPSGSPAVATLMDAKAEETPEGKPKLYLQLTSIVVDGNPVPVVTQEIVPQDAKTRRQRQDRQVSVGVGLLANPGDAEVSGVTGLNTTATSYSPRMKIPKGTELRFRVIEPVAL
jgi:hypothetical protein